MHASGESFELQEESLKARGLRSRNFRANAINETAHDSKIMVLMHVAS